MMIKTGTDLVEIKRIENSIQNPRFLTRVFSEEEIALIVSKRQAGVQTAAANFAAKEAFAKALGTGIRGFSLPEAALLRHESGEPYFSLAGKARRLADELGFTFSVSVTHTEHYAAAVVVAYSE